MRSRARQVILKWWNARMMAGRFVAGQGTALLLSRRLGARLTGRPASSLQWAIQHVFGTNPCSALTQSCICEYVAIGSPSTVSGPPL